MSKLGRRTKEVEIATWRKANPNATKAECNRQLGITRPTILKYWNSPDCPEVKTKEEQIRNFFEENPSGSIRQCSIITKISRTTIYRYLDSKEKEKETTPVAEEPIPQIPSDEIEERIEQLEFRF